MFSFRKILHGDISIYFCNNICSTTKIQIHRMWYCSYENLEKYIVIFFSCAQLLADCRHFSIIRSPSSIFNACETWELGQLYAMKSNVNMSGGLGPYQNIVVLGYFYMNLNVCSYFVFIYGSSFYSTNYSDLSFRWLPMKVSDGWLIIC